MSKDLVELYINDKEVTSTILISTGRMSQLVDAMLGTYCNERNHVQSQPFMDISLARTAGRACGWVMNSSGLSLMPDPNRPFPNMFCPLCLLVIGNCRWAS
ncbi:hypothetical protein H2248_012571 [Termitomyces sp. 'cryptogamus']|nr:hypothetical protein H2248_012571 [Termitomyces sp. 'cryptogamus']